MMLIAVNYIHVIVAAPMIGLGIAAMPSPDLHVTAQKCEEGEARLCCNWVGDHRPHCLGEWRLCRRASDWEKASILLLLADVLSTKAMPFLLGTMWREVDYAESILMRR